MSDAIVVEGVHKRYGVKRAPDRMQAPARTVRALEEAGIEAEDIVRGLFGNPGGSSGSWAAEHAELLAVLWPVALLAVFFPLAVRRFARLSR